MSDLASSATAPALRYDDFVPGRVLGEAAETLESAMMRGWEAVFGAHAADGAGTAAAAAGLALVLMMRAYCTVVAPRPPGNIHARQRFALAALPHAGEVVHSRIRCIGKEIRRERRYVELEIAGTGSHGRPLFVGTMTLVWAQ